MIRSRLLPDFHKSRILFSFRAPFYLYFSTPSHTEFFRQKSRAQGASVTRNLSRIQATREGNLKNSERALRQSQCRKITFSVYCAIDFRSFWRHEKSNSPASVLRKDHRSVRCSAGRANESVSVIVSGTRDVNGNSWFEWHTSILFPPRRRRRYANDTGKKRRRKIGDLWSARTRCLSSLHFNQVQAPGLPVFATRVNKPQLVSLN